MSEFDAQLKRMQDKRNGKREVAKAERELKVAQLAKARDAKRAEMRLSMPEIAGVVDEFKAVFGNVRVLYAKENGKVVQAKGFRL